jgi:hypothetical protein
MKSGYFADFRCDCGKMKMMNVWKVKTGHSRSCGCLRREIAKERFTTHGHNGVHRSSEYKAWCNMIQRCTAPTNNNYQNYGGRGIQVCPEWLNSFSAFIADIGLKPTPRHSLDRKDVSGNYEPGNCKWSTKREQMNNTRRNRFLTFMGQRRTVTEWCRELNLKHSAINCRLHDGWEVERALTTPIDYSCHPNHSC